MIALAVAILAAPAMAQGAAGAYSGNGGLTLLGDGVFAAGDEGFTFPVIAGQGVNYGSVETGNDWALATGPLPPFPWFRPAPVAANNVEITKNQDASTGGPVLNIERDSVGNHWALALGSGQATNTVKLISNQQ